MEKMMEYITNFFLGLIFLALCSGIGAVFLVWFELSRPAQEMIHGFTW